MTKHCQRQPDHFAPTILHALISQKASLQYTTGQSARLGSASTIGMRVSWTAARKAAGSVIPWPRTALPGLAGDCCCETSTCSVLRCCCPDLRLKGNAQQGAPTIPVTQRRFSSNAASRASFWGRFLKYVRQSGLFGSRALADVDYAHRTFHAKPPRQ